MARDAVRAAARSAGREKLARSLEFLAAAEESREERMLDFRRVRDQLVTRIGGFVAQR